jgi:hypothetical protein
LKVVKAVMEAVEVVLAMMQVPVEAVAMTQGLEAVQAAVKRVNPNLRLIGIC